MDDGCRADRNEMGLETLDLEGGTPALATVAGLQSPTKRTISTEQLAPQDGFDRQTEDGFGSSRPHESVQSLGGVDDVEISIHADESPTQRLEESTDTVEDVVGAEAGRGPLV
jgi:hypothetical protein